MYILDHGWFVLVVPLQRLNVCLPVDHVKDAVMGPLGCFGNVMLKCREISCSGTGLFDISCCGSMSEL